MTKTQFLDKQALLNPNPHTITRVTPVLHKLETERTENCSPSWAIRHGFLVFQPQRPFKCRNILIWSPKNTVIQQVTIGVTENLAIPISGMALTPKNPQNNDIIPYETIEQWFKEHILGVILTGIGLCPLMLNTCDPQQKITIELMGKIDTIALYGHELIGE